MADIVVADIVADTAVAGTYIVGLVVELVKGDSQDNYPKQLQDMIGLEVAGEGIHKGCRVAAGGDTQGECEDTRMGSCCQHSCKAKGAGKL